MADRETIIAGGDSGSGSAVVIGIVVVIALLFIGYLIFGGSINMNPAQSGPDITVNTPAPAPAAPDITINPPAAPAPATPAPAPAQQ